MKTRAGAAFLFLTLLAVLLGGLGLDPASTPSTEASTAASTDCMYGYEPYGCAAPMQIGGDFAMLARM
ncbi:hypothetical protein [Pseudomonas sp. WAC2]|uniref:hypothetical protein n=1 Tax=Pseudomonas sp. WAC2 TaxID=3055057 RepID=UPI0025B102DA|nr:hypothetical protein [Pseudomonas sp. WAC2]MDN3233973.1 hypothetical protein [Pseudomonas sp. WAC2]